MALNIACGGAIQLKTETGLICGQLMVTSYEMNVSRGTSGPFGDDMSCCEYLPALPQCEVTIRGIMTSPIVVADSPAVAVGSLIVEPGRDEGIVAVGGKTAIVKPAKFLRKVADWFSPPVSTKPFLNLSLAYDEEEMADAIKDGLLGKRARKNGVKP